MNDKIEQLQEQVERLRAMVRERDAIINECLYRFENLAKDHQSIEHGDFDDIVAAAERRWYGGLT